MAFAALALAGGCYYIGYVGEDEPLADTLRRMEAGECAAGRRGRGRAWVLVKYWTGIAPRAGGAGGVDVEDLEVTPLGRLPVGETGETGEADGFPICAASVPPPEGAHASILIREGDAGFLAIARGKPVRAFSLGGKSFGGEEKPVDRGFEISPRVLRDGRIAVTLAPAFIGIGPAAGITLRSAYSAEAAPAAKAGSPPRSTSGRPRANELRVKELAFGLPAEEGRAVMLSASAGAQDKDEVVRALFGPAPGEADDDAGEGTPARALWFQVEVVR